MSTPDWFAVLRSALASDRWDDDVVHEFVERSCELHLGKGHVLVDQDDLMVEWFVIVEGQLELRERSGHRRVEGTGWLVRADENGRSPVRATARAGAVVLAVSTPDGTGCP
jgi:hypothetical protein